MLNLTGWISVVTASIYDDIILSAYITTRELLCNTLSIPQESIYHSGTVYLIGFLLGGILWNILSKTISVKRLLLICQIMLFITTTSFLIIYNMPQIFITRFLQGLFASGGLICINIIVKHNLKKNEFNQFLALSNLFGYAAEAVMPLITGSLNAIYGFKASIIFLILILICTLYTMFIDFEDVSCNIGLNKAYKVTIQSYKNIIYSYLVFLLLIIGIIEGLMDLIFNVLEGMLFNSVGYNSNQLLIVSMSIISICSSISANVISYVVPDEESANSNKIFDWKAITKADKNIMYTAIYIIIPLLVSSLIIYFSNNYYGTLFYLISTMVTISIIQYIALKVIHSIYYSAGCVASSVTLFETSISTLIQGISFFVYSTKDNRVIYMYCTFFIVLIWFLLNKFYYGTSNHKIISTKLSKE